MTVKELIDQLSSIEDKNQLVVLYSNDRVDLGDVEYVWLTNPEGGVCLVSDRTLKVCAVLDRG